MDRTNDQLEAAASTLLNAVALTVDLTVATEISQLLQILKLEHSALNVAVLNARVGYDYALYSPCVLPKSGASCE
jgi:short-subunit dehydrogenase involved in D-alanine esterification of teichoic acids